MVAMRFFNLSEREEGGITLQRKRVSALGALNRQCNEVDDDDDAANCEENGSFEFRYTTNKSLNLLQHLCFPDVAIGNRLSPPEA
jgi:hypothetical protein